MPRGGPHGCADIRMRPLIGFRVTEPKPSSSRTNVHLNKTSEYSVLTQLLQGKGIWLPPSGAPATKVISGYASRVLCRSPAASRSCARTSASIPCASLR